MMGSGRLKFIFSDQLRFMWHQILAQIWCLGGFWGGFTSLPNLPENFWDYFPNFNLQIKPQNLTEIIAILSHLLTSLNYHSFIINFLKQFSCPLLKSINFLSLKDFSFFRKCEIFFSSSTPPLVSKAARISLNLNTSTHFFISL